MKIAAAYIRVSTDDQVEYSPASQIDALRKYAKTNDIILLEKFIFSDEGISGRKAEKRPEFMRMISMAKKKPRPFDVILVWKFSRFARNREDSIVYKSMLQKECGIDVISISEPLGEDKTAILMEALIEAMDEYYSANLAEEVKRGMTEKAKRGEVITHPSFGYKIENGTFIPSEHADNLRKIFADFIVGRPLINICRELNNNGIYTIFNGKWNVVSLKRLLQNTTYIGKIRYDGVMYDGKHAPLVDIDTFNKAQERLKKQHEMYPKYARQGNAYFMLKGLVRCDNCGATLTKMRNGLQCNNYTRGGCNISHYIAFNKINQWVLDTLESNLNNLTFKVNIKQPQQSKIDNSTFIQKEYKKLERAKEAYTAGVDTLDEYKITKVKITARISELEREEKIVNAPSQIDLSKEFAKKIKPIIPLLRSDNTPPELKNKLLRSILTNIVYIKSSSSVEIHYYTA